jgi:hypothetical protein
MLLYFNGFFVFCQGLLIILIPELSALGFGEAMFRTHLYVRFSALIRFGFWFRRLGFDVHVFHHPGCDVFAHLIYNMVRIPKRFASVYRKKDPSEEESNY